MLLFLLVENGSLNDLCLMRSRLSGTADLQMQGELFKRGSRRPRATPGTPQTRADTHTDTLGHPCVKFVRLIFCGHNRHSAMKQLKVFIPKTSADCSYFKLQ